MNIAKFLTAAALLLLLPCSAFAQDNTLSLGLGWYDVFDNDDALEMRAEYRWGTPVFWQIKPLAGVEATSDGAVYALGGLYGDLTMNDRWTLTPSFAAGLYAEGDGKDLGSTIEFRPQLEVGYTFDAGTRASLGYSHISNFGIDNTDPGTDVLNLYYHVPVGNLF